ncbi:MAG: N-acetylmuramoyl-L-alanine amidase family protein [Bacillus sp. (in: firmicutes)]|jgi:N-acetylmuramoyl-L-alanine amidase|nr:N-acetylmuramoyl-L-alanine amidase family protein [Bacillus sp. (in: firmicutes)]
MTTFGFDAGHAGFGVTPGKRTIDGTMYEWDFNNAVALLVEEKLKAYEDTKIVRLDDRTGKRDIPLAERVAKAKREEVDAVVSIHANAYGDDWNEANGIETFISEDRMPFTELELASHIQNHMIRETGRRNRGVKRGNLYMTKVSNMIPSVIVECGFMTNKEEAALLKTASYREKCARGILNGLVEQYKLKPKKQSKKELAYIKTGSMPLDVAEKRAIEIEKKYGGIVHVMKV